MKCPECDLEQPDDTAICAGCGLSFEMWREANPESVKAAVPEPGMTFPVPEEDKPAPEDKTIPVEEPTSGADLSHKALSEGAASSRGPKGSADSIEEPAPAVEPPLEIPGEKKGFKWITLLSVGLGLFVACGLTAFYFTHRTLQKNPSPGQENPIPTATAASGSSPTPGNDTPATTVLNTMTVSPLATGTPENSLVLKTPSPVLQTIPVKTHLENPSPSTTSAPDDSIPLEKPSPTSTTGPVSAVSPGTPTEAPSTAPTAGPTDLLESSEPLRTFTPTATH